jgi:hypothetical protein
MEHLRNIMEIMENDEMFPTKTEWAYVEISNELKHLHLKLKELTGHVETTAQHHHPFVVVHQLRGEISIVYV